MAVRPDLPETSAYSTQLFQPINPFIGRESLISELEHLLRRPETRLLTLTGPGGSGKTRLALRAAELTIDAFPGGGVTVSLATVSSEALVVPTVALALGLQEGKRGQLETRIAAAIGAERTLLLLDNFEHVIGAAPFVSYLLQACPGLVVVVTSRMRLRLQGERELRVPPLTTVLGTGIHPELPSEAGMLFIDRMLAAGAGKQLTDEDLLTVEEICRRVDGLPLAIELAVPWTKLLSPKELLERIEPQLPMLVGGSRDAPDRQQTMRATIQWSYDLLSEDEQAFFRSLSVFRGGFTLEAAEAVTGETAEARSGGKVLTGISSLVEKSMLIPIQSRIAVPRFTLLEPLREFAYELLTECGDFDVIAERHCRHFVEIAERYGPLLQWQQDTAGSIARLEEEQDNIRAALAWSSHHDSMGAFLRLASSLQTYWSLRGKLHEGRQWLERALIFAETAPLHLRSAVVRAFAWNAFSLNDSARADEFGKLGADLSEEGGDRHGVMHAVTVLGFSAFHQGQYDKALAYYREGLEHAEALNEPVWIAWQTRNIARASLELGDLETGRDANQRAITLFRQERCSQGEIESQAGVALIAAHDGDLQSAAKCWRNRMASEWDQVGFLSASFGMVQVATTGLLHESAAQLLGMLEALRERLGLTFTQVQNDRYQLAMEAASEAMEASRFLEAWQYGHGLSQQDARRLAVDFADTFPEMFTAPESRRSNRFGLTRRELEVIELVATGQSNRQIAESLFISMPTVKRHLSTIYGKLGASTREEATRIYSEDSIAP